MGRKIVNWTAENIWKNLIDLYNRDHGTNYTVIVTPKEEVEEDVRS